MPCPQRGPLSISMGPGNAALLLVSTASTGLLCLSVGSCVHRVRSNTGKYRVLPLPCAHHFQCVTYICMYMYIYMSRTKCKIHAVVAMHSTSVSLLPRCTWAPTKRHSSPVEAVLTGDEAALPGLVEILKSPLGTWHY